MRKRDELTDPDSCMNRAYPDEWTFVLLARDPAAPAAIAAWIEERIRLGKNDVNDSQLAEAAQCANRIEQWEKPKREPCQHQTNCIHCGEPQGRHSPFNGKGYCNAKKVHTFETSNLPPGKTCADCVHTERCAELCGSVPEDRTCDFFPIRFRERTPTA